tara:strand:- start:9254 stop:9721 length:468 start_codon:yes stop_codon:yes gene_type:complete
MLKLPLKYYDESGRILPPKWLYLLLAFFCLDWVIFIFSLASPSQTDTLLFLFYPQANSLGIALLESLPIVVSLLLLSQRERLWKRNLTGWPRALLPLMLLGISCAFCVVLYHEALVKWQFELFQGIRLLVSIASLYVVSQSRHLRWMVEDWQKGK